LTDARNPVGALRHSFRSDETGVSLVWLGPVTRIYILPQTQLGVVFSLQQQTL
jgi:hypothetical protein